MFDNIGENIANGFKNALLGWIPDWVWSVIEWWPWIMGAIGVTVAVGGLYRVYRIGGWPALTTAVGALGLIIGYVLGKRNVKPSNNKKQEEKVLVKKPVKTKHRKTVFDPDGDGKIG